MPRRTRAQMEADMIARLSGPQLDRKGQRCACCSEVKPIAGRGWRSPEPGKLVCARCWPDWCEGERANMQPMRAGRLGGGW